MLNNINMGNIFLIGPMGTGKTRVGMQLAKLSGYEFYDSDQEIEKRAGVTVSWIFTVEGEAGFRDREAAVIAELCQLKQIILATGGGAVIRPQNRQQLSQHGEVVYLRASVDTQLARTSRRRGDRPLLDTDDPRQQLQQLTEQRASWYQEIANVTYDTEQFIPMELAKRILADIGA